jgi:rhomboid protease GluP
MIPAPVGHHCPTCVEEARRAFRGARGRGALAGLTATRALLAAILAMFVLELALGAGRAMGGISGRTLVDLGAQVPILVAGGQEWRLVTAMFLHANLLHLALNAYALWLFGTLVEGAFGRARFLAIYFVSGFLGSVASYAFGSLDPEGLFSVGVGASGAIVGLLGAFIAFNYRRRHLAIASANLRWALTIIGINLVFGLTFPGVDNRAHLGGLLAGLAAGTLAEGVGPERVRPALRVLGFAGLLALGVGLAAWRTAEIRAFVDLIQPGALG